MGLPMPEGFPTSVPALKDAMKKATDAVMGFVASLSAKGDGDSSDASTPATTTKKVRVLKSMENLLQVFSQKPTATL
jgi:hypothetical protein